MKLSLPPKLMVFCEFHPPLNAKCTYYLQEVCFESHPVYDQTQGSGAVFFLLYG
jgi:hypothetical protein